MVTNFQHDHDRSRQHEPFWKNHYFAKFPDMAAFHNAKCKIVQTNGIDRIVRLTNANMVRVEEKINEKPQGENISHGQWLLSLETISNDKSGAPGWMNKRLFCDWFVTGYVKENVSFWVKYSLLREVWKKHRVAWMAEADRNSERKGDARFEGPKVWKIPNEGYTTHCLIIPLRRFPVGHIADVCLSDGRDVFWFRPDMECLGLSGDPLEAKRGNEFKFDLEWELIEPIPF